MNKRTNLAATLLTLLVGAAASANNSYSGKAFPGFKAKDAVTGKSLELKDLRGKVVLIDFWATWCGPCVRELPTVKKVYDKYKDQGFEVVSVSLDSNRAKFEKFVGSRGMPWRHVMEGGGWKTRLAKKYGINSIPAMYLVDHNGVCISDRAGAGAGERGEGGDCQDRPGRGGRFEGFERVRISPADAREGAADDALADVAEARRALAETTAPIWSLGKRLKLADKSIDSIDRQMPSPRSPATLRRRYVALYGELTSIRGEMYARGMLNESVPELPLNPFDDAEPAEAQGLTVAWGQLPGARLTVDELGARLGTFTRQFESADTKLDRLERRLLRDPRAVTRAERAEALVEANRLAARCNEAWTAQLGRAWASLDGRDDPAHERLRGELAAVKSTLTDPSADAQQRTSAQKRFSALCRQILALK